MVPVNDMFEPEKEHEEEVPLRSQLDPVVYKSLERNACLKIDLQVLPLCLLLYLLSFLDRTNVSQSMMDRGETRPDGSIKDPGIMTSLDMTPHQYATALSVLYPTYMVFEIPANLMIKRVGARIWMPFLVMAWGLVETLQGLVTSKTGLYICRVFLGLTEAGIMPGITVYLTFFYRPNELQYRQAFFFTGTSLSCAFSPLLAVAIRKMDGIAGQHGWQWVFYLEGIFTVLVGFLSYFLLSNEPADCALLSPLEKRVAVERLQETSDRYTNHDDLATKLKQTEPDVSEDEAPRYVASTWSREVWRAFTDIRCLLISVLGFCISMPIFSLAYFMPSIVKGINDDYTTVESMLMSCPPFAVSFAFSLIIAVVSDRTRQRYFCMVACYLLCIVGLAVALGCNDSMTRYGGIIMVTSGGYAGPPCLLAWIANNTAGHYKTATALAMIIILDNCSGLASAWLFNTKTEAPRFTRGISTNLAMSVLGLILATILELLIMHERRQRARGRRDEAVLALYKRTRWTEEQLREYMGDDHPEFHLEL